MAKIIRGGLWLVFCLLLSACNKPEPKPEPAPPEKNRGYQVSLVDKFRVRLPLGFPKPVGEARKEKTPFGFLEENQFYTTNSSNRVEQINLIVTEIPPDMQAKLPEKKVFEIEDAYMKRTLNGKIESDEKGKFQGNPVRTVRFFGEYKRFSKGYGSTYTVEDNIHGVSKTYIFQGFIVQILYTSAGQYDRDRDEIKEFLDSLEVIGPGTGGK